MKVFCGVCGENVPEGLWQQHRAAHERQLTLPSVALLVLPGGLRKASARRILERIDYALAENECDASRRTLVPGSGFLPPRAECFQPVAALARCTDRSTPL